MEATLLLESSAFGRVSSTLTVGTSISTLENTLNLLGIDRFMNDFHEGDKVIGVTRTGTTINIVKGFVHTINDDNWNDGTRVQLMVLEEATQWGVAKYRQGEKTSWFCVHNIVKVRKF